MYSYTVPLHRDTRVVKSRTKCTPQIVCAVRLHYTSLVADNRGKEVLLAAGKWVPFVTNRWNHG